MKKSDLRSNLDQKVRSLPPDDPKSQSIPSSQNTLNLSTSSKSKTTLPESESNITESSSSEISASYDTWSSFLQKHQNDFAKVLPKHISLERILRLADSAVRRSPQLLTCSFQSLAGGLLHASALGLEVNTPLNHASLIPFRNNRTMQTEAQLIIQYEGLIELHYRSKMVHTIFANVVYEKDVFSYNYGTDENLHHVESPLPPSQKGAITHFYAYAKISSINAFRFIVLSLSEVEYIRDTFSTSYKTKPHDSPWTSDFVSMGKKTAIRRLSKFVPKSAEISQAIDVDYTVTNEPFSSDSLNIPNSNS